MLGFIGKLGYFFRHVCSNLKEILDLFMFLLSAYNDPFLLVFDRRNFQETYFHKVSGGKLVQIQLWPTT